MTRSTFRRRLDRLEQQIPPRREIDCSDVPHGQLIAALELIDREGGVEKVDLSVIRRELWECAPEVAARLYVEQSAS